MSFSTSEIRNIDGFPVVLANELKHCILAHHGELEYGSPKKPALIEAVALSFADNIDAKIETPSLRKAVPSYELTKHGKPCCIWHSSSRQLIWQTAALELKVILTIHRRQERIFPVTGNCPQPVPPMCCIICLISV